MSAAWTNESQLRLGTKKQFEKALPPDPGRNWPKAHDPLKKMAVQTLHWTTRGEGSQDKNKKHP